MKIISVTGDFACGLLPFRIKPASALMLPHNPFFYPDFTKKIEARLGVAVRVSKPGRSVDAKFAHLHYDSFAVALDLVAADLLELCLHNKFPNDVATSFDASFPVGKFLKTSELGHHLADVSFSLSINGEELVKSVIRELEPCFEDVVASVSQYVTLREGDYIFVPLREKFGLNLGDRVVLCMCGVPSFGFNVR